MLQKAPIKVLVAVNDPNFKDNVLEYQLIQNSKVQFSIPIENPGKHSWVYFKFTIEEDDIDENLLA